MITAIDTNVLIDIFGADPIFGTLSAATMRRCLQEGTVCACEITWVEVATVFPDREAFLTGIETLGIEFSPIISETAWLAGEVWRKYRQTGGKRERVVADFLIGAHASLQADRLLTRDRGFYRTYFKSLVIVDPSQAAQCSD